MTPNKKPYKRIPARIAAKAAKAKRDHDEWMKLQDQIEDTVALGAEIKELLGDRAGKVFRRQGKVFDTPQFSGHYVLGLTCGAVAGGREFVRGLLKRLADGEKVPVMLMDTYQSGMPPGAFTELQLIDGVLYRVFPDGHKEKVQFGNDVGIEPISEDTIPNVGLDAVSGFKQWLGLHPDTQALHKEITALLGERPGKLFLHEGKIFDTPNFSGAYMWGLTCDEREGGRAFIRGLLTKLAAGERVPVMLMHKYRSGTPLADFPELQLIDGTLYRVFPDEHKEKV